jgi:hypothetical protein
MEYTQFYKPWFGSTPVNAVKAKATLTLTGVVSDTQTVTIGSKVYEFDTTGAFTAGNIQVNVASYLNEARGTLTFTGVVLAAQIVTIGTEVYEFVAAAEDVANPANIPVVMGADFSADNAVTKLGLAISSNSAIVDAVSNTTTDTVLVIADAKGTAGNTIVSTTTCLNATWGAVTLTGGLATITAANAITALVAAITANDTLVTAVDGAGDTVVATAKNVGTEGNDIAVAETLANGTWGAGVTTLSGGLYATPAKTSGFIILNGVWYIATKPIDKYTMDGWKSATPTLI